MVEIEHLRNAPITEAIIDIRTDIYDGKSIDILKKISHQLSGEYIDIKPLNHILTELIISDDDEPQFKENKQEKQHIGYICRAENERNIAQIRFDGFTFSELKPYGNWAEFSTKAKKIWHIYNDNSPVSNISRLAVRYINHMELPMCENEEFNKFLTVPPNVPEGLPLSVSNFLTRITISDKINELSANVIQAMRPSDRHGYITVLLDIDVFQEDCGNITSNELWDKLIKFQEFKNTIFFNYITEATRELFR